MMHKMRKLFPKILIVVWDPEFAFESAKFSFHLKRTDDDHPYDLFSTYHF